MADRKAFTYWTDPETLDRLKAEAARVDRSATNLLDRIVRQYLDKIERERGRAA